MLFVKLMKIYGQCLGIVDYIISMSELGKCTFGSKNLKLCKKSFEAKTKILDSSREWRLDSSRT